MVDFQSRDTRRSVGSDDDPDDTEPPNDDADSHEHDHDETDDEHDHDETDHDETDHDETDHDETDHDETDHDETDHDETDHDETDHDETDHDHHHAHDRDRVGVAIVTVSSSRSRDDDPSGDAIETTVADAGHEVAVRDVVRDDFDGIQSAIDALVGRSDVDVVVTTGGTGVTPDDVTVEAVSPLFDKTLPGFGELFRSLSYEEIGSKVVGTRATAGITDGVAVFCLPGSENAARLGAEEIIVEEAPHLVGLAQRD